MPQEPSPVRIVYYTPDDRFVVLEVDEWAKVGGYIMGAQNYIRAAGPCLKGRGSDAPVSTGVIGKTQRQP